MPVFDAYLPEPRALQEHGVCPREGNEHVVPVAQFEQAQCHAGTDGIEEQGVDQLVHHRATVCVEGEQKRLYAECQRPYHVLYAL